MPITPGVIGEYDRLRSEPNSVFGSGLSFLSSFLRYSLLQVVPTASESAPLRTATNCKPTSSVKEKVDRTGRVSYQIPPGGQIDTLDQLREEIRDLVRGRVLVDYLSEAKDLSDRIVAAAAKEGWGLYDKKEALYFPDPNGYRAFHVTLLVGTPYGKCYCEIQIFTVNQFSWASKTHPLQWKPVVEPPEHLKEIMKHLSDCLHTSDRLFETVKNYIAVESSKR